MAKRLYVGTRFYAVWVSDLFMRRVMDDGDWSLMCPDRCPGLPDCYGEAFEELYVKYEDEGRATRTVKARDVWSQMLQSQIETGTPYLLFKDACNRKSNQKHLGTIKSSNLCSEACPRFLCNSNSRVMTHSLQ